MQPEIYWDFGSAYKWICTPSLTSHLNMSEDKQEFVHNPPCCLVSKHERESKALFGGGRESPEKYTTKCTSVITGFRLKTHQLIWRAFSQVRLLQMPAHWANYLVIVWANLKGQYPPQKPVNLFPSLMEATSVNRIWPSSEQSEWKSFSCLQGVR